MSDYEAYKRPFGISVALHIGLLIILLHDISATPIKPQLSQQSKNDIVKAVAVNDKQVQAEVERIQQQNAAKRRAEIAKQRKLDQMAKAARKARQLEQARLKQLKRKIAREQAEQKKLAKLRAQKLAQLKQQRAQEQKRLAKIKAENEAQQKKAAQEQARLKRLAKEREEQLAKQKQAELEEQQRQQQALDQVRIQTIIGKYKGLIQQAISQRWIVPDTANKQLACRFQIHLAPGGSVLSVKLLRSSGDPVLDRSAEAAVYKASPLPVPREPDIFQQFRVFNLTVRPETVLSAG